MLLALVASSALLLAAVAAGVFALARWSELWIVVGLGTIPGLFFFTGLLIAATDRTAQAADDTRVRGMLDRMALLAGIRAPRVRIDDGAAPLSSTTVVLPGRPVVHVTTGLLERLDDPQLEALLAHEVAHVMHGDALLMSALAGPPSLLIETFFRALRASALDAVILSAPFVPPAALMLATSRSLSRYRELAADRVAALLTGSPAAVAAAVIAVDEGLRALPSRDLREVAAFDSFHFVPAKQPSWIGRLWATHPRTERRLAQLERLEDALQRVG